MSKGTKFDEGKLRFDLLDDVFEEEMVRVLTDGARVHGDNNWQLVEGAKWRYYAAIRRHLLKWRKGEIIDPEHGTLHLAHAAVSLMFLSYFDRLGGQKKGTVPHVRTARDEDTILLLALRGAKDYGYEAHLVLNDESVAYAHADEASWVVLKTKRNAVLAAVDEVQYAPSVDALSKDFIFPSPKGRLVYLFLDPVAGLKYDDIVAFLARSPYVWQVLL